jgi:hypothetical protein
VKVWGVKLWGCDCAGSTDVPLEVLSVTFLIYVANKSCERMCGTGLQEVARTSLSTVLMA